MGLHLEPDVASSCLAACRRFTSALESMRSVGQHESFSADTNSFATARQIGAVYSLFGGADLRSLLDGFVTQVEAMSVLFGVAGGLVAAQDEAVAAALGRATAEPAGLQSLALVRAVTAGQAVGMSV